MENFILVEKKIAALPLGDEIDVPVHIIRAYESRPRAEDDRTLLQEMLPERRFEIMEVEFIDR